MAWKPKTYKPIEFRQLCAIVKMLLQQEPSIDDAEWKARTRDHLEKLGFDEPPTEMLSRAMTQVEYALRQTVGPRLHRPVPTPKQASKPEPEPPDERKGRTNHPAGWDIVVALMAKLKGSARSGRSLPSAPRARLLELTEEAAIDEFWRQVRAGAYKLKLLQGFAEVAIVRPADWDYAGVRAAAGQHRLTSEGCFACGHVRTSDWHHVIQIQHGGSNYLRNRVCLCADCHARVHPWLPALKRDKSGWSHISGVDMADVIQMATRHSA